MEISPSDRICTLSRSRSLSFLSTKSFNTWRWLTTSHQFPGASQISALPGIYHTWWCLLLETRETQKGLELASRSWNISGEVGCPTFFFSGFRRLRLWWWGRCGRCWSLFSSSGSWSACAHCWLRCRSWAHNPWEGCVRPSGQTATRRAEWHWVMSSGVCEVEGGVEQKEGNWVRHIKEWSMKHFVSGWLLRCAKVQHIPNLSHTQVSVMICDQVRDTEKNVRATKCSVFKTKAPAGAHEPKMSSIPVGFWESWQYKHPKDPHATLPTLPPRP